MNRDVLVSFPGRFSDTFGRFYKREVGIWAFKAQCELKMTIPEESQEYTSHKGGAELEHANAPQNKLADSEPKHSLTQQHAPVAPGASFRTGGAARSEIYNSTLAFK